MSLCAVMESHSRSWCLSFLPTIYALNPPHTLLWNSCLMEWPEQPWWPTGWLWLYSKWHYKRRNLLLSQWPFRKYVLHHGRPR